MHCKKRIVILTIVVCYLVADDNTLHAWTQLIAKIWYGYMEGDGHDCRKNIRKVITPSQPAAMLTHLHQK